MRVFKQLATVVVLSGTYASASDTIDSWIHGNSTITVSGLFNSTRNQLLIQKPPFPSVSFPRSSVSSSPEKGSILINGLYPSGYNVSVHSIEYALLDRTRTPSRPERLSDIACTIESWSTFNAASESGGVWYEPWHATSVVSVSTQSNGSLSLSSAPELAYSEIPFLPLYPVISGSFNINHYHVYALLDVNASGERARLSDVACTIPEGNQGRQYRLWYRVARVWHDGIMVTRRKMTGKGCASDPYDYVEEFHTHADWAAKSPEGRVVVEAECRLDRFP